MANLAVSGYRVGLLFGAVAKEPIAACLRYNTQEGYYMTIFLVVKLLVSVELYDLGLVIQYMFSVLRIM